MATFHIYMSPSKIFLRVLSDFHTFPYKILYEKMRAQAKKSDNFFFFHRSTGLDEPVPSMIFFFVFLRLNDELIRSKVV